MQNRIKLIVLDVIERMNALEEVTICVGEDGHILYEGLADDYIPPSLLNIEVTGIGISDETVLLYIKA